ncbi:DUF6587 family protein [Burkholderia pseudomultivorans]|uniref:DUF6587 family protein n=1 Tax=Burkholderia pseudomultivorans TaxID=1207504 RepID=UPI000756125F|nr:DUF6587 family protein [Burkholderia pseudomultivorans]KWE99199.1 hypothetical protein WT55_04390 [Burkholderia pseudomultivorans]MBF5008450.1 hypothetical protein [Burkholderia pseudomultivorans]
MSAGLVAQYAVIAVLVTASALFMFRKLAPKPASRCQRAVALALVRARALRWLGQRLMPGAAAAAACGDGCSTCGACGTDGDATPSASGEQPLTFHSPARRR